MRLENNIIKSNSFRVVFVKLQPIKVIELNLFNWVKSPNRFRPGSSKAKSISRVWWKFDLELERVQFCRTLSFIWCYFFSSEFVWAHKSTSDWFETGLFTSSMLDSMKYQAFKKTLVLDSHFVPGQTSSSLGPIHL